MELSYHFFFFKFEHFELFHDCFVLLKHIRTEWLFFQLFNFSFEFGDFIIHDA
jgi:hypothetical protein